MEVQDKKGKPPSCFFSTPFLKKNEKFGAVPSFENGSQVFLHGNISSYRTSNPFAVKPSEATWRFGAVSSSVYGNEAFLQGKETIKINSNPFAMKPSPPTWTVAKSTAKKESKVILAPPKLKLKSESSKIVLRPSVLSIQADKLEKQMEKLDGKQGGKENSSDKRNVAKLSCLSISENVGKISEVEDLASCISSSSHKSVLSSHSTPFGTSRSTFSITENTSDKISTNAGYIFGQNVHERVLNCSESLGKIPEIQELTSFIPISSDNSIITSHSTPSCTSKSTFSISENTSDETNVGFIFGKNVHERVLNYKKLPEQPYSPTDSYTTAFEKDTFNKDELAKMERQNLKEKLKKSLSESGEEYESNHIQRILDDVGDITYEEEDIERNNQEEKLLENVSEFTEECESNHLKRKFDEVAVITGEADQTEKQNLAEKPKKSLSECAEEYESKQVKRKYDEVAVITGEEEEQNVLQIHCKLFEFDKVRLNWQERGRGLLRLNDKKYEKNKDSRIVMRLHGSLRVVLNTKVWAGMSVEHPSAKTVRLTAYDPDGVKIFLVMTEPEEAEQLFHLLDSRVAKLNGKEMTSTQQPLFDDENESTIEEVNSSPDLSDASIQDSSDRFSSKGSDFTDNTCSGADSCLETNFVPSESSDDVDSDGA